MMDMRRKGDTCMRAKKVSSPSSDSGIAPRRGYVYQCFRPRRELYEDDRSLCAAAEVHPRKVLGGGGGGSETCRDGGAD